MHVKGSHSGTWAYPHSSDHSVASDIKNRQVALSWVKPGPQGKRAQTCPHPQGSLHVPPGSECSSPLPRSTRTWAGFRPERLRNGLHVPKPQERPVGPMRPGSREAVRPGACSGPPGATHGHSRCFLVLRRVFSPAPSVSSLPVDRALSSASVFFLTFSFLSSNTTSSGAVALLAHPLTLRGPAPCLTTGRPHLAGPRPTACLFLHQSLKEGLTVQDRLKLFESRDLERN